jgi:hypothetical protein
LDSNLCGNAFEGPLYAAMIYLGVACQQGESLITVASFRSLLGSRCGCRFISSAFTGAS